MKQPISNHGVKVPEASHVRSSRKIIKISKIASEKKVGVDKDIETQLVR